MFLQHKHEIDIVRSVPREAKVFKYTYRYFRHYKLITNFLWHSHDETQLSRQAAIGKVFWPGHIDEGHSLQ